MKYEDVVRGLDLAADLLRKHGLVASDAEVSVTKSFMDEKVELKKPMNDGVLTISYTPNPKNEPKIVEG